MSFHKQGNSQMKKIAFAAMLAVLMTANVQADTVGLYLGGQIWHSETSGAFGEKNALTDFNLKNELQANYFIAIEHPLPFLPNVRISSTTLDTSGKTNSAQAFSFSGSDFIANDLITANYDASYVDYTFYYELLDNRSLSFDLGLTARDFNGDVVVTGTTTTVTGLIILSDTEQEMEAEHFTETTTSVTPTGSIEIDVVEPMLHVASSIYLPLKGLSLIGEGDFSLIGDHSLYNYQLGLSYGLVDNMTMDLSLNLGYKVVKMEFEDLDDLYTDLEFKGVFVGATAHF